VTTRSSAGRRALGALGCTAALLLTSLVAEPAAAQTPGTPPTQPTQPAPTFLIIGVVPLDEPATVATLTCDPPGGTHPRPDVACRDIAWAGGNLNGVPTDPYGGACPPDPPPWPGYATAFGWWRGRFVSHSRSFPDECAIRSVVGRVFYLLIGDLWVPDDEVLPCPPGRPCPAPGPS
jgi:Subtilisin inhibitor-like